MNKIKGKLLGFKTKTSNFKAKIKQNIANNKAEIVFFIGLSIVLYASFLVNKVLFLYILGAFFIVFSLFITRFSGK